MCRLSGRLRGIRISDVGLILFGAVSLFVRMNDGIIYGKSCASFLMYTMYASLSMNSEVQGDSILVWVFNTITIFELFKSRLVFNIFIR